MVNQFFKNSLMILYILIFCSATSWSGTKVFQIGFFEGGKAPHHTLLRQEYRNALKMKLPDDIKVRYAPYGFKSAKWNRDSSKTMALQLVNEKRIDLVVALGPWVVEDLLEAGFTRPIVSIHRFDPELEELLDKNGRPKASNLTLQLKPEKFRRDLLTMAYLLNPKKIGVLLFPTGDEQDALLKKINLIAQEMGVEIITAESYNNSGTFAFFKSYYELKKQKPEAVYVGPLWGMDLITTGEFFKMMARDKMPVFAYEGNLPVQKGALASNGLLAHLGDCRFAAYKTVKIFEGASPAELPLVFEEDDNLTINMGAAKICELEIPDYILNDASLLPAINIGETVSLADVIERTEVQNPGYLARVERFKAASQLASEALIGYLPQINAGGAIVYDDNNSLGDFGKNGRLFFLELNQTLFSLRTIKEIKSASEFKRLDSLDLNGVNQKLQLAVSLAFVNRFGSGKALEILRQNGNHLKLYKEHARSEMLIYGADSLDIKRWERERLKNDSRVITARYDFDITERLLKMLQNLPPESNLNYDFELFAPINMVEGQSSLVQNISVKSDQNKLSDFFYNRAKSDNSALLIFSQKIIFNKSLLAANRAKFFPELKLKAVWRQADLSDDYDFPFEDKTFTVYGILSMPLFEGGLRFKQNARLKTLISETEYQKDSVSLTLIYEIRNLLAELLENSERAPVVYRNGVKAKETLDIIYQAYQKNQIGFLDLLDAQNAVVENELTMLNLQVDYFQAMARLIFESGHTQLEDKKLFTDQFLELLNQYLENNLN